MKHWFTIAGYRILLGALTIYHWFFTQIHKLPWVDTFGDVWQTLGDATLDMAAIRRKLRRPK